MPVAVIKAPSNKTQTHPKSSHTIPQASQTAASLLQEHIPFIDKLSIVIKPANEADAHAIHSNIWTQFADKSVFQGAGKEALQGYNRAYRLAINCSVSRPLIQYRHANKKADVIRLDFNPRKLGPQGLIELRSIMISLVPDGWDYAIKHGRITRIDVMVDLQNTRMDSFVLLPKQGLSTMEWSVDGKLETLKLGKSKGNQTVVYSVKKKRLGQGKAWPGTSVIRVERRLRNPKPDKLDELSALANPFAGMVLCENLPGPPSGKENDWQWSMFGDSVKVRGLIPALALLPVERRTKYRKHIEQHKKAWWNPDAIWAHWPTTLQMLHMIP